MPELAGFIDGSYTAESRAVAVSRTVNLYPEIVQAVSGKNRMALFSIPGLKLFCTLSDSPVRGVFAGGSPDYQRCFAAAGGTLFEIHVDGTFTVLGLIANASTPVQMFQNGTQLFVVSGNNAYLHDGVTLHDLTGIVSAQQGAYLDGYFIAMQPNTNVVQLSALNDGLSWDPLDAGSKEGGSDRLLSILADHELLWLFGENTSEVWYDSGALNFPLQRVPGAFIEQGILAPFSAIKADNSIFWLGGKFDGSGIVFRTQGFSPVRVSDHAMEYAINQYPTMFDAVASTYVEQGHTFYRLDFPSGNATWVYDTATGRWHERGYWNLAKGDYDAHLARFHAYAFFEHLVGDYRNGNIYIQSKAEHTDNGNPLRWMRRSPHVTNELLWIKYQRLQIDMQVGGASETPDLVPSVSMRYSDDGGFTWADPLTQSLGAVGAYNQRVFWRRLGRSRDRVFEISGSDPVEVAITDAYLDFQAGTGA